MMVATTATVHRTMGEHSRLFRDLLLGFVKIRVLCRAGQDGVYGAGIRTELKQHGYQLSPGMLYPLLHNLEAAGLLTRHNRVVDGKVRKYYRTTPLGEQALEEALDKIADLVDDIA